MTEKWKKVPGYPYDVSNYGRVRSYHTDEPRVWSGADSGNGYRKVSLCRPDGPSWDVHVHRLVALLFIGPPPSPSHEVNHIDHDGTNNSVENLEWVTRAENLRHAIEAGRWKPNPRYGEDHHASKLTDDEVREIRQLYGTGNWPQWKLGERFGVAQGVIHSIVAGDAWPHITGGEPVEVDTRNLWSGSSNGKTELTEDDVLEIRERYATGQETMPEIAEDYPITKSGIRSIVIGRTWKHVGGPLYEPEKAE